ncbi:MAG: PQQ-binding-like beta-propeller repeat protein [Hyphomicrobiales bacterium]|nr:PQQ-binding-like beta-propeller repeat protein [Hyphomicrobiales bacterium]
MTMTSIYKYSSFLWLGALATVAGCGIFGDDGEILPGERYSILTPQEAIEADPGLRERTIVLPRPVVNTQWSQPGGTPANAPGSLAASLPLESVWEVSAGQGSSSDGFLTAVPIIAEGRAYVLDANAQVRAFNTEDGDRIWSVDLVPEDEDEDEGFGGGIAFEDGKVFVATGFGDLFSLDAATGERIWHNPVGIPFRASPTAFEGRVFVETYDNNMAAYDADTGEQLWTHQGVSEAASILGSTSPAVIDSTVIVPYSSGELVAIRVDTGNVLWRDQLSGSASSTSLAQLNDIAARPVVDGGEVIVVSHSGGMVSIDLRSGQRKWAQQIDGIQTPAVVGDYIFAVLSDGVLICLDRETGGVFWAAKLPGEQSEDSAATEWAGPVVVGGALFLVSSDSEGITVDPGTGSIIEQISLEGEGFLSPVVANETVYILTDNARLTAYR